MNRLFAEVRTRANFGMADSREATSELTKAAGGDAELSALLVRIAPPLPEGAALAKAIALVDGSGKVTGIEVPEPALPGVAEAARSLPLTALSWPGHSLRSVRTIEFLEVDGRW